MKIAYRRRKRRDVMPNDKMMELADAWKRKRCQTSMSLIIREMLEAMRGRLPRIAQLFDLSHDTVNEMAMVAIWQNVETYDASRGMPLRTYIHTRVHWMMHRLLADELLRNVLPSHSDYIALAVKIPVAIRKYGLVAPLGEGEIKHLAELLKINWKSVRLVHDVLYLPPDPVETACLNTAHTMPSPEDMAVAAEVRTLIHTALNSMGEREAHVVRLRFMDGLTLQEVAEDMGFVSREGPRRLETRGLRYLKHPSVARRLSRLDLAQAYDCWQDAGTL